MLYKKYLKDFFQVYLHDILIYNHIKKKYIYHVSLILNKLREIDLQINIKKCEFDIKNLEI